MVGSGQERAPGGERRSRLLCASVDIHRARSTDRTQSEKVFRLSITNDRFWPILLEKLFLNPARAVSHREFLAALAKREGAESLAAHLTRSSLPQPPRLASTTSPFA